MRILLALVMLLASITATAQTTAWNEDRLTWSLAGDCQDGQPLSACPVTGIRVETATSTTGPWTILNTLGNTATSYLRTSVPVGLNHYRVGLVWSGGVIYSNLVSATTVALPPPPPPPKPPVLVVAEVVAGVGVSPVFRILQDGSRSTTVAGFVQAGKPCLPPTVFRYRGRDYQKVDPMYVKWWSTTPTPNVAVACG
jgi:hypothetical protein